MQVVMIYRKKRKNAYSIEQLFELISNQLKHDVHIINYEVGSRWSILKDIWNLYRIKADVYHVTGDVNYFTIFLPYKKTILTIHDIRHYLYSLKGIKRKVYKWIWLKLPIYSSNIVTAVSDETKMNIREYLNIKSKDITVIENCYNPTFKKKVKIFNKKNPVILQVGTKSNKNIPRLIESLKGLNCRLVLIGQIDVTVRNKLIDAAISFKNYQDISFEEVVKKYIESDIVTCASLGEGFGIPIIEAQAVGRPIITSNISPMKEIAGKDACLIAPLDITQYRRAILKIINEDNYRENLIENGLKNVERFSLQNISNEYLKEYRDIYSKSLVFKGRSIDKK